MSSIPQKIADELLVKCGRHCCICRRFDPLHLAVHHIVERADGGGNEPDNLIAVCLTCHSDVHTDTKLSRRFTEGELKGHREQVIKLVADGRLTANSHNPAAFERLAEVIVARLLAQPVPKMTAPAGLSAGAVQMLLSAVQGDGTIFAMSDTLHSSTTIEDIREQSHMKDSLDQLQTADLTRNKGGIMYCVTHQGFLLADQLLAAAQETNSAE